MGTVQALANMSLDGYIAKQDNTIGRLFDWLQNGEVAIPARRGLHRPPHLAECRALAAVGALTWGAGLRPDDV